MIRCVVLHRKVIFNSPILRKAWGGPSNEIQFEHVCYIYLEDGPVCHFTRSFRYEAFTGVGQYDE
jgi:hypothetical protein